MKHGAGGYAKGCRCDDCRDGMRAYSQDYRDRGGRQRAQQTPERRFLTGQLPDWMRQAACTDADPDLFNGITPDLHAALEFCNRCPVWAECREFGERDSAASGVYGGVLLRGERASGGRLPDASDETVRKLHSLYSMGHRDELACAGEREYHHRRYAARQREAVS